MATSELMTTEEILALNAANTLWIEQETRLAQRQTKAYVMGLEAGTFDVRIQNAGNAALLSAINEDNLNRIYRKEEHELWNKDNNLEAKSAFIYGQSAGHKHPLVFAEIGRQSAPKGDVA